jgi:hypothetical protein
MPNAEGVTAITAWMISCIFFVFCGLMCYAHLLWRLRPSLLKSRVRQRQRDTTEEIKQKKNQVIWGFDEVDKYYRLYFENSQHSYSFI